MKVKSAWTKLMFWNLWWRWIRSDRKNVFGAFLCRGLLETICCSFSSPPFITDQQVISLLTLPVPMWPHILLTRLVKQLWFSLMGGKGPLSPHCLGFWRISWLVFVCACGQWGVSAGTLPTTGVQRTSQVCADSQTLPTRATMVRSVFMCPLKALQGPQRNCKTNLRSSLRLSAGPDSPVWANPPRAGACDEGLESGCEHVLCAALESH